MNRHWNNIFANTDDNLLGWYENNPSSILELLDPNFDWKDSIAFLPGIGTSDIFEELLSKNIKLILNDISQNALEKTRYKLGDRINKVILYHGDIAKILPPTIPKVDLWIDRAVLHFLTEENDIEGYFQNLRSIVKRGGFALFAQFSLEGAAKCAGLNIHRYSAKNLSGRLGDDFQVVNQFDHTYINPYGDPRPYIYVLYKRLSL
jgi:hypothetical protein